MSLIRQVRALMSRVVALEIEQETTEGVEGGFLAVRRLHLRNRREDGSRSSSYICDFLVRPKGVDAVVVAIYHHHLGGVQVLLRDGLRPALSMGRRPETLPIPDVRRYLLFTEVVAGIIERDDVGEDGIRKRAALEVEEEAGYRVDPASVVFLGAGSFPSPGSMAEKFWFMAVEVEDPTDQPPALGDGSPMEEGASTRWMPLEEAIAACVDGRLEDVKTELVLRRLQAHLADADPRSP